MPFFGYKFHSACHLLSAIGRNLSIKHRKPSTLLDSHIARAKSNMPLEKKRITAQLVREVAIGFAKIYWNEHEKKEEDERPRISEAAEFIHQTIKTTFSSEKYQKEIEGSGYEIPEDISIIKKWLRPTAPAWAKKGGRPAKKTNFAKE